MSVITSLVGYWALDEASGNALDSHGTNPLTEVTTIGTAAGKVSNARDYPGSTAPSPRSHSHASNSDLSLGADEAFTWAGWAKSDDGFNDFAGIVCKSASGQSGNDTGYRLWTNAAYRYEFSVANGTSTATVDPGGYVDPTVWRFIVVDHDPVANEIGLQIDNGTRFTTSWSGGTQNESAALFLGYDQFSESFWDGLLDEWGFWKKVLTPTERTWLYNSGSGRSYADIVAEAGPALTLPWLPVTRVIAGASAQVIASGFIPPSRLG